MATLIFMMLYIVTGAALVHGALYISHYDLEMDGFDRARFVTLLTIFWPLFLLPMLAYWMWIAYHSVRGWVRSL